MMWKFARQIWVFAERMKIYSTPEVRRIPFFFLFYFSKTKSCIFSVKYRARVNKRAEGWKLLGFVDAILKSNLQASPSLQKFIVGPSPTPEATIEIELVLSFTTFSLLFSRVLTRSLLPVCTSDMVDAQPFG